MNRQLNLESFDRTCIALIIKSGGKLFPKPKATCLPIRKDILEKIIENKPVNVDKSNIDIALKIV